VWHIWEEVRSWLNKNFGQRRSVATCYRQAKARDYRADALAAAPAADAVAEPEAPVAHVDAHKSIHSRSATASSMFRLPARSDAREAFVWHSDTEVRAARVKTQQLAPLGPSKSDLII
jgi:hypothetical protein